MGIFGRISDILSANLNDFTEHSKTRRRCSSRPSSEVEVDVAAELAELKQRLKK